MRLSILKNVLCWLMAVQFLNLSVDTRDMNAFNQHEDLSINDQESLIELIVEKVFGWEQTFKEADDADHEKNIKPVVEKVFFYCSTKFTIEKSIFIIDQNTAPFVHPLRSLPQGFMYPLKRPPRLDLV